MAEEVLSIAVLANGPSLRDLWKPEYRETRGYDLVLGVNTSAWIFDVDVWCVLDPAVVNIGRADHFKNGRPLPPKMATRPNAKWLPERCEYIEMPWYNRDSKHLPEGLTRELGIKNCNFTFPNALYTASLLSNGGQVDIYGMDITPETDVCEKWGDRTASRWTREIPWTAHAWQPHWRIYGRASQIIRDYLYGEIAFTKVVNYINKYSGGQSVQSRPAPAKKEKINAKPPRVKQATTPNGKDPAKAGTPPKGDPAKAGEGKQRNRQEQFNSLGIQTYQKDGDNQRRGIGQPDNHR